MFTERTSPRRVAQNELPAPIEHQPPARKTRSDEATRDLLDRIEHSYDAGIIAAVAARPAAVPAPNTDILYVGLNFTSADAEKSALAKTGSVRAVGAGPNINGTRYDFSKEDDVARFVDTLHLDPRDAANVRDAIVAATPPHRATLAQIALALADGERGGSVPSRLVISAHSGGSDLYGAVGGFAMGELKNLFKAMPHAGAQIQDLHFSACSTSGQAGLEDERNAWLDALPHLKTIWSYTGTTALSPVRDLEAWGRLTNQKDDLKIPRDLQSHHIAIWSVKSGYRDNFLLAELREHQAEADTRFNALTSGTPSASTNAGHEVALRDYETYRVLSQRSDVPKAERDALAKRADQLLRIRYYPEVRAAFAKRHGDAVKNGFAAVGIEIPDFATLDRRAAMVKMDDFEQRFVAMNPAPPAAVALAPTLRGLRNLDSRVIPESDCQHP